MEIEFKVQKIKSRKGVAYRLCRLFGGHCFNQQHWNTLVHHLTVASVFSFKYIEEENDCFILE